MSMNKSELPFLSATVLSELLAAKEVSPVEATEAYLERIQSLDNTIRAFVPVTAEAALVSAKQSEQEIVKLLGRH